MFDDPPERGNWKYFKEGGRFFCTTILSPLPLLRTVVCAFVWEARFSSRQGGGFVAKSRLGLSPGSVTSELCVPWQSFFFFFFNSLYFAEQCWVHSKVELQVQRSPNAHVPLMHSLSHYQHPSTHTHREAPLLHPALTCHHPKPCQTFELNFSNFKMEVCDKVVFKFLTKWV